MAKAAIISNTASSNEPGRPEELSYLKTQQQERCYFFFFSVNLVSPNILLYYYVVRLQGFDHGIVHSARFANGHRRKRRIGVQIRRGQYNGFSETGLIDFPDFQHAESGAEQCECEHHQPKSSVRVIFDIFYSKRD